MLIFTALIPFMQLHNRRTGSKARDAVLAALSLRDASLLDFVAHQTLFCRRLAEGLGAAYIALPSTLEPRRTSGGAKGKTTEKIHLDFVNRLQFVTAVLDTCTSDNSGSVLAEYLCRNLHRWFLVPCLLPALSSVNEAAQVAAMTYTGLMVESVQAASPDSALLTLLSRFLLGLRSAPEMGRRPSGVDGDTKVGEGEAVDAMQSPGDNLRSLLVHRIGSQAPSVAYAALELFSALLEVGGDGHVLQNLVLRNIPRRPAPKLDSPKGVDAAATTATSPQKICTAAENPATPTVANDAARKSGHVATGSGGGGSSPILATPSLDDKDAALMVTPAPASSKGKLRTDALKSPSSVFLDGFPGSPTPAPGTASRPLIFEDYLTDAHTQSVARMAAYWSSDLFGETQSAGAGLSPSTSAQSRRAGSGSGIDQAAAAAASAPAPAEYVEGSFLGAIYDKLEGMLDETLDENLALTAILAKLAQCPHQGLHDALTWDGVEEGVKEEMGNGASGSGVEKRRSLVLVLREVWQEAQERAAETPGFDEAIQAHRLRLGTNNGAKEGVDGAGAGEAVGGVSGATQAASDRPSDAGRASVPVQSSFCEGYIVLEEFVKEMSAIIQARGELGVVAAAP